MKPIPLSSPLYGGKTWIFKKLNNCLAEAGLVRGGIWIMPHLSPKHTTKPLSNVQPFYCTTIRPHSFLFLLWGMSVWEVSHCKCDFINIKILQRMSGSTKKQMLTCWHLCIKKLSLRIKWYTQLKPLLSLCPLLLSCNHFHEVGMYVENIIFY